MSTVYQLYIALADSEPTIWRRVTVGGNTPFDVLHQVIQTCMGWENAHIYEFLVNNMVVHDPDEYVYHGKAVEALDLADTCLEELVTMVKARFTYCYNAESTEPWIHEIIVEGMAPSDEEDPIPVCLDGAGLCPPDEDGGVPYYQDMLLVLHDKTHPMYAMVKEKLGSPDRVRQFNREVVNELLLAFAQGFDPSHNLLTKNDGLFADDDEDMRAAYERMRHFKTPQDLLLDLPEKNELIGWLTEALEDEHSLESMALSRLISEGHDDAPSRELILQAQSIERFYELKFGLPVLDDRYRYNLEQLPTPPVEIPSLACVQTILNTSIMGIPHTAIEYLHNDTTAAATNAIVETIQTISANPNHDSFRGDALYWYTLAAEGHIAAPLIDALTAMYVKGNFHRSEWVSDQGAYLITKLAQKFPELTTDKILTVLEKEAAAPEDTGYSATFLFEAFHFHDIDLFKDRLLALLKNDHLYWIDYVANTIVRLQIKEAIPLLYEQMKRWQSHMPRTTWHKRQINEFQQAIDKLKSEAPVPPEDTIPYFLNRGTTWKEELEKTNEAVFYGIEEKTVTSDLDWGYGEDEYEDEDEDEDDWDFDSPSPMRVQRTLVTKEAPGRNDPCPCGSGKLYKMCCLDKGIYEV